MAEIAPIQAKAYHRRFRRWYRLHLWANRLGYIIAAFLLVDLWAMGGKTSTVAVITIGASYVAVASLAWLLAVRYRRKTKLFCSHCGKFIDYQTDWVCGRCDHSNAGAYPSWGFFGECPACGEVPGALVCPHCESFNFLDAKCIDQFPAQVAGFAKKHWSSDKRSREREMEEIQHQKELAVQQTELIRQKRALAAELKVDEPRAEKPKSVQLEESFAAFRDGLLTVDSIAERELREAEQKYGKDSEMFRRYQDLVNAWREEHIK